MRGADYGRELRVVEQSLKEAAQLCIYVQSGLEIASASKPDRSPVTVADYGSQALVCRALRDAFPEDAIVAEEDSAHLRLPEQAGIRDQVLACIIRARGKCTRSEFLKWIDYGSGHCNPGRFWTLDPIDGTKGFLRGEHYAIALALVEDGQVVLGGLACPNLDGGFLVAVRAQGARKFGSSSTSIAVSSVSDVSQARCVESVESAHSAHGPAAQVARHLGITAPNMRLDSQAKYAAVAQGDADIYMRLPTRPGYVERIWDHAAGALILEEAGGCVTDCQGKPLDFSQGRRLAGNRGVIATNGKLHNHVLCALRELEIGQAAKA